MRHLSTPLVIALLVLCAFDGRSQNSWTTGADLPADGRADAVGFTIGNKAYAGLGGVSSSTVYSDIWEYDPTTNQWTAKDNYPGAGHKGNAAFVIANKAYVGMGDGARDMWEFDPSKPTGQQWVQKADYPGTEVYALTAMSIGSFGYAGIGNGDSREWWMYNPSNNQWTAKANYPGMSYPHYSGFAIGNRGYILDEGGASASDTPYIMEYDPDANTWTPKTTFTQKRTGAVTFVIGGKGYFGGGSSPNAPDTYFNDFYEYDPVEDVVVRKADIQVVSRTAFFAFAVKGKGYFGAGYEFFNGYWKDLNVYTPETINCTVANHALCAGQTFSVSYDAPYIVLNAGNTIKVELSDASGSFASAVTIGTITTTVSSGAVNATIPANATAGTGYRVRVKSSNTAATSLSNSSNITVNSPVTPTISLTANPGSSVLLGAGVTITANVTNGGNNPQFAWTLNGSAFGENQSTLAYADYADGDVIQCTLTSNAVCASTTTANSNTITMTIDPNRPGDIWTKKNDLPAAGRIGPTAFAIGGKAYVGFGNDWNTYRKDLWQYDPVNDTWTQKANSPQSFSNAATWVIGDKAYFSAAFPGFAIKSTYMFDPVANTWTQKTDFPGPNIYLHYYFAANGKGYVGGGRNTSDDSIESDLWQYDPQTDTWTSKASTPTGRVQSFSFAINNKGYVGGGGDGNEPSGALHILNDLLEYDPLADTWTSKAPYPNGGIYFGAAAAVDGKAYVDSNNGSGAFFEYDPVADSWATKAPAPTGRVFSKMFGVASHVYVVGGQEGASASADVWQYTPDVMSVSAVPLSCPGDVRDVKWTSGKFINFAGDNVFTVQLSDPAGNFSDVTVIGTATSAASNGTMQVTFPSSLAEGTYRMRVVSTSPAYSSSSTVGIIPIHARPATTISIESNVGTEPEGFEFPYLNISVTNAGTGPDGYGAHYVWKRNGVEIPEAEDRTQWGVGPLFDGDSYTCTVTAQLACALPVESNAVVFHPKTIRQLIVTLPITESFCSGTDAVVSYSNSGFFMDGTMSVEAQLSSKTGSFEDPTVIGSGVITNYADEVLVTIPDDLEFGTGYRIRVMPVGFPTNWSDSGDGWAISSSIPYLSVAGDFGDSICEGELVTFTATTKEGVTPDYQWMINGNAVGGNEATFSTSDLATDDIITCTIVSKSGCYVVEDPVTSSATVAAVNPSYAPSVIIQTTGGSITGCVGDQVGFSSAATGVGYKATYEWFVGSDVVGTEAAVVVQLDEANPVYCIVTPDADVCVTASAATSNTINVTPQVKPATPSIQLSGTNALTVNTNNNPDYVYNWYFNAGTVQNKSRTLPVIGPGVYKVLIGITGSTCESDMSEEFTVIVTGDIPGENVSTFFPNPAEDILTVRTPGFSSKQIYVFQMNGGMVAQMSTTRESEDINVKDLSPGVYLLRIINAEGVTIGKFIKR